MRNDGRAAAAVGLALTACAASRAPAPVATPAPPAPPAPARYRLHACTEEPVRLPGPPGAPRSRGCVVTFRQRVSDPESARALATDEVERRYLVYAPVTLSRPAPVVLVFPGYTASAEAAAVYYTHTRFEELADRDGFVVVYGNGLPNPPPVAAEKPTVPKGGFLQGCFAAHAGEGIDVAYVRLIIEQLAAEVPIDRARIYATGLSAGGGMAFELALEAPDLVAAIAPVAGLPFQPTGPWLFGCHPRPGHESVSIAMLAATDDPFISYLPGPSREYPAARYPGMEQTRDAWLAALGISGAPEIDAFPDVVRGDSYEPQTGRPTSTIERQRYRPGPDGRELWYYKAVGAGHWWPNPTQIWGGLWARFGKTNQDVDFADEAWVFFRRHARRWRFDDQAP